MTLTKQRDIFVTNNKRATSEPTATTCPLHLSPEPRSALLERDRYRKGCSSDFEEFVRGAIYRSNHEVANVDRCCVEFDQTSFAVSSGRAHSLLNLRDSRLLFLSIVHAFVTVGIDIAVSLKCCRSNFSGIGSGWDKIDLINTDADDKARARNQEGRLC